MPILSNQGRTVPELPSISSGDIGNSDLLIIQNIASNSTKRSSILDFCVKSANLITSFNNLKFTGAGNSFTGSINNSNDTYSILTSNIPNILRRLKTLDYLEVGQNNSTTTGFKSYVNDFLVNQSVKSSTTCQFIGNGSNSSITIQSYPNGLNVNSNTPVTVGQITATSFIGNLTGNVVGDINYSGAGQSYFFNLNVDNQLTVAYTIINNADINGGTIDGTLIGSTLPYPITGSKIWGKNGLRGNLTGDVTGNVIGDLIGNVNGNVIGDLSGNVNGTLYGNVNVSAGTSNVLNLNVNNSLFAANSQLTDVNIDGGNIDNTIIGSSLPKNITGTTITANTRFLGRITGSVLGNVKGNVQGNVIGNVTATVVSADNFVGGDFTGTSVSATNFSGDLNGNVTGDIKSPLDQIVLENGSGDPKNSRFFGTSSYSLRNLTSSYAIKAITVDGAVSDAAHAVLADLAISSYTSSYVAQFSNIRTNSLAYYNGQKLNSTLNLSYEVEPTNSSLSYFKFSGSNAQNYFIIDSKPIDANPPTITQPFGQSALVLSLNQNRKNRFKGNSFGPEYWNFLINTSGSFYLQSTTASYNFNNAVFKSSAKANTPVFGLVTPLKIINNNILFWSDQTSNSTPSRDGTVAIGVAPTNDSVSTPSNLKSRFQIDVFSSSLDNINKGGWNTVSTVRHHHCAILVRYGSGSNQPLRQTFYVSSSGNIYSDGNLNVRRGITSSFQGTPFRTQNNKQISFWGTGSHSVSSSFAVTSSFSNTSITSSYSKRVPYYLFSSTTYGTTNDSTISIVGQKYKVPAALDVGPDRVKKLNTPTGRVIRWFKIHGTIRSQFDDKLYKINGISLNNTDTPLESSEVFCSWGWGNGFKAPVGSMIPFTIEGKLNINSGAPLFFTIAATEGIPDPDFTAYVILYYDN